METLEAIATRRSVRRFTDKTVSKETINKILQAAMNAPSAGNEQPWHFLVINDRKTLNSIPTIHPYAQMCLEAPVAIIPCLDPNLETHKGFGIQDLSAATQNILLAIRDLGLAAVWVGVYPNKDIVEKVKKLLGLPESIIPLNIIPFGYTDTKQQKVDRYQKERIHYNQW